MSLNIAVFASGSGTNAENIITHFKGNLKINVKLVLSNNPQAGALQRADKLGIETFIFSKNDFYSTSKVIDILAEKKIDFIVLAGFLWLVPKSLIAAYPKRIINIHPALLPNYGGKGMFGNSVHQAVIANRERESGITIHYVNDEYDKGAIIFQSRCPVSENDTAETLAKKIHELEYRYFPAVIEKLLLQMQP